MDWDLSSYFTEFGSPIYTAFKAELVDTIAELDQRAGQLLLEKIVALNNWETLLIDYEHMQANFSHIASYIGCLTAADAKNESYLRLYHEFIAKVL